MASTKKPRTRNGLFNQFLLLVFVILLGFVLLISPIGTHLGTDLFNAGSSRFDLVLETDLSSDHSRNLPKQNHLSASLEKRNKLPPRNSDLYPTLPKDHIPIVLYVHNRPQYLRIVIDGLSQVDGINETLLIVSHDGYFEEMIKIVESIKFCQVKQIFAPYSPHIFLNSFPGVSPTDCKDKENPVERQCEGTTDQFGNHRSLKIVSLKHHWWWMMNAVWDGLKETQGHSGHILFIEEDHFIFPNAYRNLKLLAELKSDKCPKCYALNLAPSNVKSRGEGYWEILVAEAMGNIGYAFNRTMWRKIYQRSQEFCSFDDYNWDVTMWVAVFPLFDKPVYSFRGPRASAVHFGKCGLHQGQGNTSACIDHGVARLELEDIDKVVNIKSEWEVYTFRNQNGYKAGHKGWGGWGDKRDHQLCLAFASMYRLSGKEYS